MGLENDDKAGKKNKEISIFIDKSFHYVDGLCTKKFKANLTFVPTDDTLEINFNDIIKIGSTLLKINPIKKNCFDQCNINKNTCPLLGNVFYASVLQEGSISIGDKIKTLK
ncbi:MAG: hypothetical protein ACRC41_04065 [Sarcina sp.]